MNTTTKMAFARLAKQLRRERRQTATLRRTRGQIMQRMAASAPSTPRIQELWHDVNQIHEEIVNRNRRELLLNMFQNLFVAPSRRRYTDLFLRVAFTVATVSLPCYLLLRRFLILPSYTTLFLNFRDEIQRQRGFLTNVSELPVMLAGWTQTAQEKSKMGELGGF